MAKKQEFISGMGRRKRATARIWLYDKKGDFTLNDKPVEEVFNTTFHEVQWLKPFHTVGIAHPKAKFSGSIKVNGGGIASQLTAVSLAITRALIKLDPANKEALRKAGLTTRDPREVERKKTSLRKARKTEQYSKR